MATVNSDTSLTLNVNGSDHALSVNSSHTLLEVLRDDLGLTGSKRGCEDGTCGTCTVVMNGRVVRACRVPLSRADGADVQTIESLGTADQLHPLQQAFVDADAVQCGFCTPGMILAAKALLDRNPKPSRRQIMRALGSNLCRCTGYNSIVEAIARIASAGQDSQPIPSGPAPRDDAPAKALGTAMYAGDLTMPGMLRAAILRSPHHHAEIVSIDYSEALKVSGVVTVATAEDVPGLNRYGRAAKDQPVLADDKVRQIGDPVAAVAAESQEAASEALALVRVEYKLLDPVLDASEAINDSAPRVHEGPNMTSERRMIWGDAEAGLAEADIVIDRNYTTPAHDHAYLEPDAALAYQDEDGRLVIRSATQWSHHQQEAIAETMALSVDQVRFWPTTVGGAFGGKNDPSYQTIVSLLALKTGRPVKIVYTRAESFAATTKRHAFTIRCRTGVTEDGRLTALYAEMIADTGAYASSGPSIFVRSGISMTSPYHFPSAVIHGRVVYTNNPIAGSMRGFGAPQAVFAMESQMDLMAAELGIDPLEFRVMNRRQSDVDSARATTLEQEESFRQTLEAIRPHYDQRERRSADGDAGRWVRGYGIASMRYGVGSAGALHSPGRVLLELEQDGHIRLLTGSMEIGQGSDTAWKRIVSDELSLSNEIVRVTSGDTDVTPDSGTSGGSRLTYYAGNAAFIAAGMLREAVLSTASGLLEQPPEALHMIDDGVAPIDGQDATVRVSLADVAEARASANLPMRFDGEFAPVSEPQDPTAGDLDPFPVYVSATQLAEVEVDREQGVVRVIRVVAAHDVGKAVFPQGLIGQIEGAVSMGIGQALTEEYRHGESVGFKQYRIPTSRDAPEVIPILIENGDPSAGLGAKGAAECALVPVAPSIINAIANATGVRVHDLPATPARLLELMRGQ